MPRLIFGLLLFFCLWGGTTPGPVLAESLSVPSYSSAESIVDLSSELELGEFEDFLANLDQDMQAAWPEFSLSQLFSDLKAGNLHLDPETMSQDILRLMRQELVASAPLIGQLLVLAVLCAILQQLQVAFDGNVGRIAQLLAYLVLFGLALTSFQSALNVADEAIGQMVGLMQALTPVMLTLLVAMGNITTAALFKPVIMGSLAFLGTVLQNVVLPLFFLAAVLKLFNQVSGQFKLTRLAGLFEFAGKVSLGLVLTLFIGIMTVQGVTGGVTDGVMLRTAKYSADLIPVVGRYFKDAVELVASSGILLKNALGIAAIIALALICLGPLIKIFAMILIFRISAALVEPLGEQSLAESLQGMAQSLVSIFAVVASVTVMFFITVAVIVGSGNLSVMLR